MTGDRGERDRAFIREQIALLRDELAKLAELQVVHDDLVVLLRRGAEPSARLVWLARVAVAGFRTCVPAFDRLAGGAGAEISEAEADGYLAWILGRPEGLPYAQRLEDFRHAALRTLEDLERRL